ncbi:MAG TPA: hypothetical protein VGM06_17760 [Polyangiaceae bacterium]
MREGPYRQLAAHRGGPSDAAPAIGRQALLVACACLLMLLLAVPVVALAEQPFSLYATLVTGALAALTAVTLIRIGFAAP